MWRQATIKQMGVLSGLRVVEQGWQERKRRNTALDTLARSLKLPILSCLPNQCLYQHIRHLHSLSRALHLRPFTRARTWRLIPPIELELLDDFYLIAHSRLHSGAALDTLLSFFSALSQIAMLVVPGPVIVSLQFRNQTGRGGMRIR